MLKSLDLTSLLADLEFLEISKSSDVLVLFEDWL
jgi:hypothetical protein